MFALSVLAFAQPLFALLGQNGEFFVASGSGRFEIALLTILFIVVPPGVLLAATAAAGLLGARKRRAAHLVVIAGLCGVILLPLFGRIWAEQGSAAMTAAALTGTLCALLYQRVQAVQFLVSVLALGILAVPANFLLNSDATRILFPRAGATSVAVPTEVDTPVVVMVFDELPLGSLLNERLEIDAGRFPNFGKLAATAHWFRNATSVSDNTAQAVPALVTGRYPGKGLLPTAADHPESLFTLLADSYSIRAREPMTRLCPAELCHGGSSKSGFRMLLTDAAVVLGHALLPDGLARAWLPSIDMRWRGFADSAGTPPSQPANRASQDPNWLLWNGDSSRFGPWLAPPFEPRSLRFIHLLVPHAPWRFLPSGNTYGATRIGLAFRGPEHIWVEDRGAVTEAYRRHLLQVGFADRLLGELMSNLENAGVFDEALVIVLSDHGGSFRPGDSRRFLTDTNLSDLLRVPLLVKLPGQKRGTRSDLPVQTIDLLPTIAEVLKIRLPFSIDGLSLLSEASRPGRLAFDTKLRSVEPPRDFSDLLGAVNRKTELFGSGEDVRRLYGEGRFWRLVGRTVDSLRQSPASETTAVLTEPDRYTNVQPASGFVPALVSGRVSGFAPRSSDASVAVTINGTVAAVTPLSRFGQTFQFQALVPENAFREGHNEVGILVVDGTPTGERIVRARTATAEYALRSSPGAERLESTSGQVIAVRLGEVRGFVDGWSHSDDAGHISIAGWVFDPVDRGPPAVLAFAGRRLVGSAGPTTPRRDVSLAFQDENALQSGFLIRLPASAVADVTTLRLFGVSPRGVASELQYARNLPFGRAAAAPSDAGRTAAIARNYRLTPAGGLERIDDASPTPVAVSPGAIRGYVDTWSDTDLPDHVTLSGWAADLTHAGSPTVLVFADDRLVGSVPPTGDRPDVARAFHDDRVLRSGFVAHIPLSKIGRARRLRVFGVSVDGRASELSYPPGFSTRGGDLGQLLHATR